MKAVLKSVPLFIISFQSVPSKNFPVVKPPGVVVKREDVVKYSQVTGRGTHFLLSTIGSAGRPAGERCHVHDSSFMFTTMRPSLRHKRE